MRYLPPKTAPLTALLLALTLSPGLTVVGRAEIISFQDPATGDGGYPAQDFEEKYDWADIYQLDDLNLGDPGWRLQSAATYWEYGVVAAEFYRIRIYSDLPDSWDTNQYFIKEYSGVSAEYGPGGFWEVSFDLEDDAYSGTIWIAGYVRADYDQVGQEFWRNANAQNLGYNTNGSEEYFWNWGANWGPDWPIPGSTVCGQTADMSWKIEGTPIPEPGLLSLIALGIFARSLWPRRAGR